MSFFHSYIYLYINIHTVYRYIYENPQVTQKPFFFPTTKLDDNDFIFTRRDAAVVVVAAG